MLERHEYPPGVPCWVDTAQPDPDAATRFYGGLFGWEFENQMPDDAPGKYLIGRIDGRDVAAVGSQPEGGPPTPVWNTYIAVADADETAAKVTKAGGSALAEPFDVLEAGRMGIFSDPQGAVFSVWQAKEMIGAQLVNEPGTWSFSDLNTRDVDSASAFYGGVFGWVVETTEGGGMEFSFLRLPGYGDFLVEKVNPDLRVVQEEVGAPTGFEDVVAGLVPMTSDRFPADVPPHWSVTFLVDDADASAARAEELGGTILAPPMDAGPTRIAVVRDPQGATFTVSRFYPERL
ncbi:MAG TPA: VOC family protein [Acidimicrobiia bacterium]|nr:VOC family protein [Acidimicrobiia bacterium]